MLVDGRLTSGHARTLVSVDDQKKQKELADLIINKGLNVREAEKLAAQEGKNPSVKKPRPKPEDFEMTHLVEDLRTIFGTKIDLHRRKDKGRIVIEYYSKDEFVDHNAVKYWSKQPLFVLNQFQVSGNILSLSDVTIDQKGQ